MRTADVSPTCPYSMPPHELPRSNFSKFCSATLGVSPARVQRDINHWLDEDHGAGDVTVFSALENAGNGNMFIVAKQDFILCGLHLMSQVFRSVGENEISLYSSTHDGKSIKKGEIVLGATGPASALLLGERVALNLASRLSGIATKTNEIFSTLQKQGESAPTLLETRKTTPGLRLYEKYATRTGGARNHRHGLDGGAMIKENHLRAAGGLTTALKSLKLKLPILTKIEVEVSNMDEFIEALKEGADVIMLDNFPMSEVHKAVLYRNKNYPEALLEISGNLDLQNIHDIAKSGVNFASMGALIHKAIWVDMSMQFYK